MIVLASLAGCEQVPWSKATATAKQLQAQAEDPRVRALYELNEWRPIWTGARERELAKALDGAVRHGLAEQEFRAAADAAEDPGAREAALTLAALTYAQALASGVIDPKDVHDVYTLERNEVDVVRGLHQAVQDGQLGEWLASLPPKDEEYRALSEAYLRERAAVGEGEATPVAGGALIRPGDQDQRVPALAQALARQGYLAAAAPPEGSTYDGRLVEAVKALQQANGLKADGVVGETTLQAINFGPALRARQLAVNMERRRWLARNPPPRRIDVNTAATELVYYRDGRPAWRTRVVAGGPGDETPLLQEPFEQLVVNPPWHVPTSIAEEEILPKGDHYLARQDMYVEDGRVIQRPGPRAALGRVKFDMQNPHAIYLHDTPAKSLFQQPERHRSHGCVRVEDAVGFARRLAEESGRADEFERVLNSGKSGVVELGTKIPVRLVYHTAYLENGALRYASDPYGWDGRVAERLGLGADAPRDSKASVTTLLGP